MTMNVLGNQQVVNEDPESIGNITQKFIPKQVEVQPPKAQKVASNPFEIAKSQGYTNEQIIDYLSKNEKYANKIKTAKDQGYTDEQISEFMVSNPQVFEGKDKKQVPEEETGLIDKGLRIATQLGIGATQAVALPYDVAAIASKKIGQGIGPQLFRQNVFKDITRLAEQKHMGIWDETDQRHYDYLIAMVKNPEKMKEHTQIELPDIDTASLIEKGAEKLGLDLKPKGWMEHAARWIGLIKDPKKSVDLLQKGITPKTYESFVKGLTPLEVLKKGAPSAKDLIKAISLTAGMQFAADAELGPIGSMMALTFADLAPTVIGGIAKGGFNLAGALRNSVAFKRNAARAVAMMTTEQQKALQRNIINDFRAAGLQADLGSVSGNNLIKWIQNTLAQSGLTGEPLERLRNSLTQQVTREYGEIARSLGEVVYESRYEAGQVLKNGINESLKADKKIYTNLYEESRRLGKSGMVKPSSLYDMTESLLGDLEAGKIKSSQQKQVIQILSDFRNEIAPETELLVTGQPVKQRIIKEISVPALTNNKIALNEIIDYEVQGGAKQLLKGIVKEVDNTLVEYGKTQNPEFLKAFNSANAKFSKHAQTYRTKFMKNLLKNEDPSQILNKMNTPAGIEQIRKGLANPKLFNTLARHKLEELIGSKMTDSVTHQLKFGTFSKLLEKGQTREVIRQLLGNEQLTRLERLQRNSGVLAETAQKFLNTSRSGVHATDLAFAGKLTKDLSSMFTLNPWPALKTGSVYLGTKQLAKLIADPEFIRLVEEEILRTPLKTPASQIRAAMSISKSAERLLKEMYFIRDRLED